VQDEAGGIAQALGLCEAFVGTDHCCVILGDNIFYGFLEAIRRTLRFNRSGCDAAAEEGSRSGGAMGVAELSADRKSVVGIEEKPKAPKSDYAVTGMYFYDASVFNIVRTLKPSGRNELEITDVNNEYVRRKQLLWDDLPGEWTDAGHVSRRC